jgi:hypothetical protein
MEIYFLAPVPAPQGAPPFTLGNLRFIRNGLQQIGLRFFKEVLVK